jgi:hypothetical protein
MKQALAGGLNAARGLLPQERRRRADTALARAEAEMLFDRIGRSGEASFAGTVLVDGSWDNPNFWLRYALLRSALGLSQGREVGLLGPFSRRMATGTFGRFGIETIGDATASPLPQGDTLWSARRLLAATAEPGDILRWQLPNGLPAAIVFDGILKRQRSATVDLHDPDLSAIVAEALQAAAAASALFDRYRPSLIVLSHAINFGCGALAWEAARRGTPAVVAYGNYGVPRFWRIATGDDLIDCVGAPSGAEIDALSAEAAARLAERGERYFAARLTGRTDDIGARYAYQRAAGTISRAELCRHFGWDPGKRIIAVYASNWFDFPHGCGMTQFTDFLDWLNATLAVSAETDGVNWLFKAHPCDEWYGGVTLSDLMAAAPKPHIGLAPVQWNGAAVMAAVDGVVTVLGTAGLEYAALGKPALIADRGWYHDAGFVLWPRSRGEYLAALRGPWWERLDPAEQRRRANIFAGWYFVPPDWQAGLVLGDDSEQARLYGGYPALLATNAEVLQREIASISRWWRAPHRHYHVWKIIEELS